MGRAPTRPLNHTTLRLEEARRKAQVEAEERAAREAEYREAAARETARLWAEQQAAREVRVWVCVGCMGGGEQAAKECLWVYECCICNPESKETAL